MNRFRNRLNQGKFSLTRKPPTVLQVNIGKYCNLACTHCHVASGPHRKEMMNERTIQLVLKVLKQRPIHTLDLTGGAPELHPQFRSLIKKAYTIGVEIIDRCNLAVLFEPDMEDIAIFLSEHQVQIVASLPCYEESNVDSQRGGGVFSKSIQALRVLNQVGYGKENNPLKLHLVYNPTKPSLPPDQNKLERTYKRHLQERWGITFNNLYTITNMPITRYEKYLKVTNQYVEYIKLLTDNFNKATIKNLMCRETINVDYEGYLFDCDFNQALNLPLLDPNTKSKLHLRDLLTDEIEFPEISTDNHCFGCTAGSGSSCGGSLVD